MADFVVKGAMQKVEVEGYIVTWKVYSKLWEKSLTVYPRMHLDTMSPGRLCEGQGCPQYEAWEVKYSFKSERGSIVKLIKARLEESCSSESDNEGHVQPKAKKSRCLPSRC